MSLRESFIHLTHSRLTSSLIRDTDFTYYSKLSSFFITSFLYYVKRYIIYAYLSFPLSLVCSVHLLGLYRLQRRARHSVLHTDEPHGDRATSPSSACFIKNSQHRTESRRVFFSTWVCAFVISCTITSYSKSFQRHSINWFCSLFENALMHKPNKNFNTTNPKGH